MILLLLIISISPHLFASAPPAVTQNTKGTILRPQIGTSAESINAQLRDVYTKLCLDGPSRDPFKCAQGFATLLKQQNYYVMNVEEYQILIWKVIEKNLGRQLIEKEIMSFWTCNIFLGWLIVPRI